MTTNELAQKKYADLKIQAMMFDMDIDIETWSLVPKAESTKPTWLTRWLDKQAESDYTVIDNGF